MQRRGVSGRIVEVPILFQFDVPISGDQKMSRWDLKNAVKKRTHLVVTVFRRLGDGFGVPTRRHSGFKQSLYLRRNMERLTMDGVEEGFDAEAIARREEGTVVLVPQHKCELAAQFVKTLDADVLVKV